MSDEAKMILKDLQIEEIRKELINQDKYISKLKEEYANKLQQKENIIKEVREKLLCYGETFDLKVHQQMQKELLEILDKEKA